jgi:hypothetical protein
MAYRLLGVRMGHGSHLGTLRRPPNHFPPLFHLCTDAGLTRRAQLALIGLSRPAIERGEISFPGTKQAKRDRQDKTAGLSALALETVINKFCCRIQAGRGKACPILLPCLVLPFSF